MRTETFSKRLPLQGKRAGYTDVPHVRVECDICPATLEYEGSPTGATRALAKALWSIGHTGICRCPACTKNRGFVLERAMGV